MKTFKGILAVSQNRVIGLDNKIPWKVSDDLKFFKTMTLEQNVIFGRKTYNNLPPLPNRHIWVMTRGPIYNVSTPNVHFFSSIDELPDANYWVCGGMQVYKHFKSLMSELYITYVYGQFEGDTFLPDDFESEYSGREIVRQGTGYEIVKFIK